MADSPTLKKITTWCYDAANENLHTEAARLYAKAYSGPLGIASHPYIKVCRLQKKLKKRIHHYQVALSCLDPESAKHRKKHEKLTILLALHVLIEKELPQLEEEYRKHNCRSFIKSIFTKKPPE